MTAEEDFVCGLQRGSAAAFERLVSQFETPLYRYFLAAHGDPQLAGEQSADCFGDLVEALPKMVGGAPQLKAFVFGVARNVLRRSWRRSARDNSQPVTDEIAFDCQAAPEVEIGAAEERAKIIAAIRSLDGPTRDVFLLRFLEQMSVAEVAEVVGEPVGTVKSRLHYGRKRLLEILKLTSRTHE